MPGMTLGHLAIMLAAILWAIGATFARTLIDRGASVVELTAGRAWIALAGLGLLVLLRRKSLGHTPKEPASNMRVHLLGFGFALVGANFTYYAAISLLPVAVAIIIQYTAPGLVVVWKALVAGEAASRRVVAALILALAGVLLISGVVQLGGMASLPAAGIALGAGSAVSFAAYVLIGENVGRRLGSDRAVFYGFLVASVFWSGVLVLRGRPDTLMEPSFIPGILFLGIFTTILPFLLFLWGLGMIRASAAGIISTLEPVGAALLAYLWLGQSLTFLQLLGAAAVLLGIAVVQTERPASDEAMAERAVVE